MEVVDTTKTTVKINVGLWHSGIGILIKRVAIQVAVAVALVSADALMTEQVDWGRVIYAVRFQVGYILLSTFQTYRDPQIPNTSSESLVVSR